MNVVFMGTPDFAVPSLNRLHARHRVSAVFCQPDRPKGRSRKPVACPVKQAALSLGLEVHQPRRIRTRKWVALLEALEPDLIVVAAYGQILSQKVLDVPRIDCINVHASILPRWRGASPIHHAIRAGDGTTGVSIMRMVLALDAGPVYETVEIPIGTETGRLALEAELAVRGAELLTSVIPDLESRTPVPQDEDLVTHAPIIEKDFGYLDPAREEAAALDRAVRAYEEWPSVVTRFRDQSVKWHRVRVLADAQGGVPGTIVAVTKKSLVLACGNGTRLALEEVQPSGKKAMPIAAFINGYKPEPGERFEVM